MRLLTFVAAAAACAALAGAVASFVWARRLRDTCADVVEALEVERMERFYDHVAAQHAALMCGLDIERFVSRFGESREFVDRITAAGRAGEAT